MTRDNQQILNNPFLNRGTAFTLAQRQRLGLTGMLPSQVQTIDEQAQQAYEQFSNLATNLVKRRFLMTIFNENRTLFFYLMARHVVEFMPIVYDPTVADSIEQYSHLFTDPQNAAFISVDRPEDITATLKNAAGGRDIRLVVVTDAQGILGIGDWGVNGVDIAVGKLMVYTAAAGINPAQVLAVSLDAGTDNEKLLRDPLYLGNRHRRVTGAAYDLMVDRFVAAVERLFPAALLHWEDFGRANAQRILDQYSEQLPTFNDDIQGTGMVVLAGVLGALAISHTRIADQRVVIFGAGSAGMGIARQLYDELQRAGLSASAARDHIFAVDKQGLLFTDTPGLTPAQRQFARQRGDLAASEDLTTLAAVVRAVHPTVLIGTSTQPGAFTEELVREMAAHTPRPIIFPLSNPTKLAEATASDLLTWTNGKALIATGIPAGDVEYAGTTYHIGQGNNALMYPGLGFGLIAASARVLNGETLSAACHALGGLVDPDEPGAAVLPSVAQLAQFSQRIAEVVAQSVVDQKLNREPITDVKTAVADLKWTPQYR